MAHIKSVICSKCSGTGQRWREKCRMCDGKGWMRVHVAGTHDARDRDILKSYKRLKSIKAVAERFRLSSSRIHQIVTKLDPSALGPRGKPRGTALDITQIAIIKHARSGANPPSLNTLAAKYKVTVWAIRVALGAP